MLVGHGFAGLECQPQEASFAPVKLSRPQVSNATESDCADEDSPSSDLGEEIVLDAELLAKIKSRLADKIELSSRYKTLFFGLKLDHPRNVAIWHPVLFLMRRAAFFALAILLWEQPLFAVLGFLCLTLATLA